MYIQTSSLSITIPYPSFLSPFYRHSLYPCPSGFMVLSVFFNPLSSSLLLHLFPPLTGTLSFFPGYLGCLFLALLYFCYLSYRPVRKRHKRNVFSLMSVKVQAEGGKKERRKGKKTGNVTNTKRR